LLITRAEIDGSAPLDVRVRAGKIAEIGSSLAREAEEPVLDAAGGALLPGLHDHHIHLFALAEVRDVAALAKALARGAERGGWIRGVAYHESVAGDLDRALLDGLVPDRPVRIQHRSGAMWAVNSPAAERLGLDRDVDERGVERDADGQATGRLFRLDAWLRERLDDREPPNLAAVSQRLAAFGVTGLTDATPENSDAELRAFVTASDRGELLQRLLVMGAPELPAPEHSRIERGAVKVLLDERDLLPLDELLTVIANAHAVNRSVAIHCVTRSELVLAAAVAPPDVVALVAALPLTVVTQPGFIRERGDAYLSDVEPRDRPWLYRCRGWLHASVPLGGSTDAPFGDADPWRAMQAAVDRRTESDVALGPDEGLTPERALALFTSSPDVPGGPPRTIEVGAAADLCVLDRPWSKARSELSSDAVAATIRGGSLIWQRS
jgi:predicted amidohydrolase YtcJ